MSEFMPTAALPYPALPPVAVNEGALVRFTEQMDRQVAELEARFVVPRQHPRIGTARHRNQPPRKPR
jgi:hypothetical protein